MMNQTKLFEGVVSCKVTHIVQSHSKASCPAKLLEGDTKTIENEVYKAKTHITHHSRLQPPSQQSQALETLSGEIRIRGPKPFTKKSQHSFRIENDILSASHDSHRGAHDRQGATM
jgi:hypothetical protein